MKKTLIVYHSSTSFTRQYAQWLTEELQADCVPLHRTGRLNLSQYECLIFGSWLKAGRIQKLKWFWQHTDPLMQQNTPPQRLVFFTGAMPMESEQTQTIVQSVFQSHPDVKAFYCPGGLHYETMPVFSRMMLSMFKKMVASKRDLSEEEKYLTEHIGHSFDLSDKKYLQPVLEQVLRKEAGQH